MILPYLHLSTFSFGPLRFQYWGLFVALGILIAWLVGRRVADRFGATERHFSDFAAWAVVGGLVGARIAYVLMYDPNHFLAEPLDVFRLWEGGMSIVGGLVGAGLFAWFWTRLAKVDFWRMADLAAFVLPLGLGIGRVGCYLINDHPGIPFAHFPAVAYPGGPRLDLGLVLSVLDLVAFFVFLVAWLRRGRQPLPFLAWFAVTFGTLRLLSDFLRAWDGTLAEPRLWLMTPAQYVSVIVIVIGVLLWRNRLSSMRNN